jgi:hypothetical protein
MAVVPFSSAFISGVTPSPSAKCTSALFSSSSLPTLACPPIDAVMSAEMLPDRALFASASFFNSDFMTLTQPSPAPSHSAVTPLMANALALAPSFNSRSTI